MTDTKLTDEAVVRARSMGFHQIEGTKMKEPDWAVKAALTIIPTKVPPAPDGESATLYWPTDAIAAALRKAKADGIREVAHYAFTGYRVALNEMADKIEKGETK